MKGTQQSLVCIAFCLIILTQTAQATQINKRTTSQNQFQFQRRNNHSEKDSSKEPDFCDFNCKKDNCIKAHCNSSKNQKECKEHFTPLCNCKTRCSPQDGWACIENCECDQQCRYDRCAGMCKSLKDGEEKCLKDCECTSECYPSDALCQGECHCEEECQCKKSLKACNDKCIDVHGTCYDDCIKLREDEFYCLEGCKEDIIELKNMCHEACEIRHPLCVPEKETETEGESKEGDKEKI